MTYAIIYNSGTGAFFALTDRHVDPLPVGYAAKSMGTEKPDLDAYAWDAATLGLVPCTPQRLVSKYVFIQRFTDAERRSLFSFSLDSTKTETQRKNVFAFERYLDFLDIINLDDTSIVAGMTYLETVAILAPGRAAQILS